MRKLVFGVGINDADYVVEKIINGKHVRCPFYAKWKNMLMRCYCGKYQDKQPTYIGCSVTEEWITFSNFKRWMETQDWEGKELDKDLLFDGNKIYSPETCVFVDLTTNRFMTDRSNDRGDWPVGVSFNKRANKFRAYCNSPFTKRPVHLGFFTCPEKAHSAWKKHKHDMASQLADVQPDSRVANSLRKRYPT